ncbi:MAG: tRNA 2-thiouridine(34) synthase MnmA [Candidatus Marinimicrobia bacterium]|nr:tRNA 2-thiouridine(34) synthase MnmA [Candidatus Neomarinimicrobiota bacterium]
MNIFTFSMIKTENNKKIGVAVSGGIDSSVAIHILQQNGYDPIGFTLKLLDDKNEKIDVVNRAKKVCEKFNIEHVVIDGREIFKKMIKDDFAKEYLHGNTPNPCVLCNKIIKWNLILNELDERKIKYFATGHYCKNIFNNVTNRFEIHKANDKKKDQSYFLWKLTQKELSRTIFPLGNFQKEKIQEIAEEINLFNSERTESQDICFISNNDYRHFLNENYKEEINKIQKGTFVNEDGEILGHHNGYYNFTIGQRRGLKIAVGHRIFVKEIIPEKNEVILAEKEHLLSNECLLKNVNLVSVPNIENGTLVTIKIRYRHIGIKAKLFQQDKSKMLVKFNTPAKAVTPGQSAVFYDGELLLGGGIISNEQNLTKTN